MAYASGTLPIFRLVRKRGLCESESAPRRGCRALVVYIEGCDGFSHLVEAGNEFWLCGFLPGLAGNDPGLEYGG